MLPEGWKHAKLGEIIKLSSGDKKPNDTVKEISRSHHIPVYGGNGIMGYSTLSNIYSECISIGRVGEYCGSVHAIKNTSWITDNSLYTKEMSKNCDFSFIYYLLINSNIPNLRNKGGQPLVSQKPIYGLPILLPPLSEQKKIAAILSTWDRAIEGTEKLLANSQQQKKTLMQQLLTGKKRLPGFTGEWRICSLSDVATVQTATSKTQYICENGERFIVDMGSINRLGNLVCTKSTQHNADLLPKGTLVMPKDDIGGGNIIGRTSYIDRDDLYVLGDHVYALHIDDCDSKFVHFIINSYPINKNLRRRANGTAQLGLGKKDVLRQKIKIPSELPEQKAIAAVLTTADEEITALESDLSRLRQEKKALMQQLLTGKRRVTID
ncbi:restriction endonuclease subunit S [Gluconobacter sp. P1D12_c]|uniref:restriction endonuclease subunit S n=1 Tax=Gluconobacter sp. P1D12_c TaxID=2762614 RepID=UPI001C048BAA|nr:restriction endonuclease subunit S [Gluconobacter sp. P1D12_c]